MYKATHTHYDYKWRRSIIGLHYLGHLISNWIWTVEPPELELGTYGAESGDATLPWFHLVLIWTQYLFIYLFIRHETWRKWVRCLQGLSRSRTLCEKNLFYISCIKKCMVNRNSLHDLLYCCLFFKFHGCLLVEGFVAVCQCRRYWEGLVDDLICR